MAFDIVLAPEVVKVLRKLSGRDRALVKDAIERHLRHEPTRLSKNRIKRLRGLRQPQYRLRVGDIRVFYDVTEAAVEILSIVPKSQAEAWLAEKGAPGQGSGPGSSEE